MTRNHFEKQSAVDYEPFKGRELDTSKQVDLYRSLDRDDFVFSLRQGGLLVGHTDNIYLRNCTMHTGIEDQQRNVHDFVTGHIVDMCEINEDSHSYSLCNNPYDNKGFFSNILGEVTRAEHVWVVDRKIFFKL